MINSHSSNRKLASVNCYLFNAHSIANKLFELHNLLYVENYNFVFITESWLNSDITVALIDPHALYSVIRKDRIGARGGGVCALIRKDFTVVPIVFATKYSHLEIIGFDIVNVTPKLRLFVIYRSPHYNDQATTYATDLVYCLSDNVNEHYSQIIMGDFNLPRINWINYCCPNDCISNAILKFFIKHGFRQLVNFPKRDENILDLLLTDDDHLIHGIEG